MTGARCSSRSTCAEARPAILVRHVRPRPRCVGARASELVRRPLPRGRGLRGWALLAEGGRRASHEFNQLGATVV